MDMPRIQVVVSDVQKTRWSDYADESPQYDSVSDLIRTTVETEITTEDSGGSVEDIDEVLTGIDDIESQIGKTEDQIRLLRADNVDEDDFEDFIYSDFQPIIEKIVESAVRDAMWEWTDDGIIRPNLQKSGLTADRIIDMSSEELQEFIETEEEYGWR